MLDNIALFDMDGSLFDYNSTILQNMAELRSPDEPVIANPHEFDGHPHLKARSDLIRNQPGWWENLPIINAGLNVFIIAQTFKFTCHILTKGPKSKPAAWAEKVKCCQKHFGKDIHIHITSDKGMVYGKMLYDDYPPYMLDWLKYRPRGLGIMPVNDYNKDFTHPNVIKWTGENIQELAGAMRKCYDRQSGEELKL